jgi:hypothetical protein
MAVLEHAFRIPLYLPLHCIALKRFYLPLFLVPPRFLLPPDIIALFLFHLLSCTNRWSDPAAWMRQGFVVSARFDSMKRHYESLHAQV